MAINPAIVFGYASHARQHSYLMGAHSEWRLAPAYDLTFSGGPGGEHYMAIEGEGRAPTRARVVALWDRRIGRIIDEARAALAQWPQIAMEVGVTISRASIGRHLAETDQSFGST